jgi:hypothetical protein
MARALGPARRQIVKRKRLPHPVEIDLRHTIERLPDAGEFVELALGDMPRI